MRPFRWDLSHPEQLVHVTVPLETSALLSLDDLRACAVRTLEAAGDADLVFVGRSPESLYDSLGGVLQDTSWEARLHLLLFSARGWPLQTIRKSYPGAVEAMQVRFTELGLAPEQLIHRPRPIAFIDLVASGETFGRINEFLEDWSSGQRLTARAWRSRVRFVGIVAQGQTSPKAWRWQQNANWVRAYPPRTVRNVSVPWSLWDFLGNEQAKVTPSHHPARWADVTQHLPPRGAQHLAALQEAARLRTLALSDQAQLAAGLADRPAMQARWCRALQVELSRAKR